MEIKHPFLKQRYERHLDTIARSINPQFKREINAQAVIEAKTAALLDLKEWHAEHKRFYEETRAEMEAKASVILPDGIDQGALGYVHATLTRQWSGMSLTDIQKAWNGVLKRGDKTAALVYMQHAPFAIAEKAARENPVIIDGQRPRRWDGKPYQGAEVLALIDKSLQLAAPEAHAAKQRIASLDSEMSDVKIGYSIAHNTIENLAFDGESVAESNGVRANIRANF